MADMEQVLKVVPEGESEVQQDPTQFTTSNGVVFKLRAVPPLMVNDVRAKILPPEVPKVFIEDKETWEENPNDPAYREKYMQHLITVGEANNAVLLVRGAAVVHVPGDVEGVEGTEWSEFVEDLTGIKIPGDGWRRRFCWMKYVALAKLDDYETLMARIMSLSGMTKEVDVARALESFRNNAAGNTAAGVRPAQANVNGSAGRPADAGDSA